MGRGGFEIVVGGAGLIVENQVCHSADEVMSLAPGAPAIGAAPTPVFHDCQSSRASLGLDKLGCRMEGEGESCATTPFRRGSAGLSGMCGTDIASERIELDWAVEAGSGAMGTY